MPLHAYDRLCNDLRHQFINDGMTRFQALGL